MARHIGVFAVGWLSVAVLAAAGGTLSGCNAIAGIEQPTLDETVGPTCNDKLTASQQRAASCVYRISCDPIATSFNLSRCVSLGVLETLPGETCNQDASSCSDIEACLSRRYEGAAACDGQPSGWSCPKSGQALYCDEASTFSVDCGGLGASCVPHQNQDAPYTFACQPTAPPTCSDEVAGQYYCDGSVRYTCLDGTAFGTDCAGDGMDCVDPDGGGAQCTSLSETCDRPGNVTCNGSALEYCDPVGRLATYECDTANLSCGVDSVREQPDCLADGCKTTERCTEGCQDDRVARFCVGGVAFGIDCTKLGFDGCAEAVTTAGAPLALCAVADLSDLP